MNVCTEPVSAPALCELVRTLDDVIATTPPARQPAAVALALAPYLGRDDLLRDADRRGIARPLPHERRPRAPGRLLDRRPRVAAGPAHADPLASQLVRRRRARGPRAGAVVPSSPPAASSRWTSTLLEQGHVTWLLAGRAGHPRRRQRRRRDDDLDSRLRPRLRRGRLQHPRRLRRAHGGRVTDRPTRCSPPTTSAPPWPRPLSVANSSRPSSLAVAANATPRRSRTTVDAD